MVRTRFSLSCCHALGVYSLKGIKFIAQWQATLGAAPWGIDERKLRPVKGKSPMCQAGRFLLLPLIGRTMRVMPTQGVASLRSPCPALWTLWAFSPSLTTNYSLLTDAAPQGISVNSCSFVVLNKTNFRGHPLRTAPVFPCK